MTRSALRHAVAVLVAATALLFAATPAASASPRVIDPRCGLLEVGGVLEARDPSETPAGLPPQVTTDDMACILLAGEQRQYFYFDDAFATFVEKATSFAADGWAAVEVDDDGNQTPADLATLPAREATSVILQFDRGADRVALFYLPGDADVPAMTWIIAYVGPGGGTGIDDPSTISDVRTIADAAPTPAQTGVLLISSALLTLLLALPAYLLSRVIAGRYDQWFGWLERGRLKRMRDELATPRSAARRWTLLGVGMLLAAFVASFIDPDFGFNGLSVRLYLTLLATFVLFNVGAWGVVTLVMRRVQPDAQPVLTFHPASLLAVGVAVLLSRLLQFDPGIVFGLVAGTAFAVTLALSREALVILAGTVYAAAVALIAWIGYSVLSWLTPLDVFAVGITEFFGALTLEGVSTIPIALIPLATLDGGILFRWKRWVWGVAYAAGMALFLLVLFNLPGGTTEVDAGFWRWVTLFAVFAVLALGVWVADTLVRRRRSDQTPRETTNTTADTSA